MLNGKFKFEEDFISEEWGTTTMYFTAPKEMLNGEYPEAEFATISIECPTEYIDPKYANVEISPTKYDEEGGYTDYEWCDIDLPYEDIEKLIKLAEESGRM